MTRREALSSVSVLFGGVIVGAQSFLSGCAKNSNNRSALGILSAEDIDLLDEVAETIIPATDDSPGAKAAQVGTFMNSIVTDCYDANEQKEFTEGLENLRTLSKKSYGKQFIDLSPKDRYELVMTLEKEAANYRKTKNSEDVHYYTMIKQLTIWGYFSSEPGATKALRHVRVPGRYEGCIPLKAGEKAWA